MKNYFVTLIIASAVTVSVVIIRQRAQAQPSNPQPMDTAGAMMATRPAFPAMRLPKPATLSSPVTHLGTENRNH
jgi:hypothetical protein